MKKNDLRFEEIKRERTYDGFLKIDKIYFKQEDIFGNWTEEFTREVVYRRNAVAVLIRDPKTDNLLFTKQLRAGAYIQEEPWIYEMIAGLIDPDEDKITALKREAEEEAGIKDIKNIQEISAYYPSCGGCSEKVFLFYAEADLSDVPQYGGCPEEHEVIETLLIKTNDAFEWMKQGKIGTANGHAALYWLMTERLLGKI